MHWHDGLVRFSDWGERVDGMRACFGQPESSYEDGVVYRPSTGERRYIL